MTTALMYAELSSRVPISGSAFAYTYVTFGELPAFLVGWNLNLRYAISASGLSRGLASYFNGLLAKLGYELPERVAHLTVFGIKDCSIEAVAFLFILTLIYTFGMEESNIFNMVFTILKLVTLGLIIVLGYINFNINNFTPFTLEEHGDFKGTFFGASLLFYGYLGFDFITTLSEDARNPMKDIPSAVRNSVLICMALYFLSATSLSGMARIESFNPDTAMADAFSSVGYEWASILIYFCAFFGITAACFTNLIVSAFCSLIIFNMSRVNPRSYRLSPRMVFCPSYSLNFTQGRAFRQRAHGSSSSRWRFLLSSLILKPSARSFPAAT